MSPSSEVDVGECLLAFCAYAHFATELQMLPAPASSYLSPWSERPDPALDPSKQKTTPRQKSSIKSLMEKHFLDGRPSQCSMCHILGEEHNSSLTIVSWLQSVRSNEPHRDASTNDDAPKSPTLHRGGWGGKRDRENDTIINQRGGASHCGDAQVHGTF
ncbi:hypothetical protein ACHAWF_014224 [Thalassiosira exigua]